jgi:hypothetical protein
MGPRIECLSCSSKNQRLFDGEVAIHFPGRDGFNKPIVWVFPSLSVCLDCGVTQFTTPERELKVLTEGRPVQGAVVSL